MSDEEFITGELRCEEDDRNAVMWFAERMIEKLAKNRHKAHWSKASEHYLEKRLSEEVKELSDAIGFNMVPENADAIISECCDVALFAMMIADNAGRKDERHV